MPSLIHHLSFNHYLELLQNPFLCLQVPVSPFPRCKVRILFHRPRGQTHHTDRPNHHVSRPKNQKTSPNPLLQKTSLCDNRTLLVLFASTNRVFVIVFPQVIRLLIANHHLLTPLANTHTPPWRKLHPLPSAKQPKGARPTQRSSSAAPTRKIPSQLLEKKNCSPKLPS